MFSYKICINSSFPVTCMTKITSVTPATIFPFITSPSSASPSHLCSPQQRSCGASDRVTGAQEPPCPGLEVSWSEHVLVPTLVRVSACLGHRRGAQPGNGNLSYQQQGGVCGVLCFEQRSEPVPLPDTD